MTTEQSVVTENYGIYLGDSCDVLQSFQDASVHLSIYSPPFLTPKGGALYSYSSSIRDISNARTLDEGLEHYGFIVKELVRLTKPGRMTAVHCTDIPSGNTGCDHLFDLPGEIIRLHERHGFRFAGRYMIWKEPLGVRNRTMAKNLAHRSIVEDSSRCTNASADQLLIFRRKGQNTVPITHPVGLTEYAGEQEIPEELHRYRGWTGNQIENRFSHWIWRQYASSFWHDIRMDRVLPYREAKDEQDERHVHPLQLDVIERCLQLWSNPDETILTPFMGVGSEVYGAVRSGRHGIGVELKASYFRQAVLNVASALDKSASTIEKQPSLFEKSMSEQVAAE
jgi:DNA modification methylase